VLDPPDIPDPPAPQATPVETNYEELARRNAAQRQRRVSADSLRVDQGIGSRGQEGTGLKLG
jgi:hypothetical protein